MLAPIAALCGAASLPFSLAPAARTSAARGEFATPRPRAHGQRLARAHASAMDSHPSIAVFVAAGDPRVTLIL